MRRIDWLLLVILLIGAAGGRFLDFGAAVPERENPRRPSPELFEPDLWDDETRAWLETAPTRSGKPLFDSWLPREGVVEGGGKPRSSVGSAFSISRSGHWLTARHVVEGCRRSFIQVGRKKGLAIRRTVLHPSADVALVSTRGAPEGLAMSQSLGGAEEAVGVGFPKGQPGAVYGRYLGEMTVRHTGRGGYRERVVAWSERSRIPGRKGSLGGLSGGALLDREGRVIGIVQAEERRRGRFLTARPDTVAEVLSKAGVTVSRSGGGEPGAFTASDYPRSARRLITALRVAKVYCEAG